MKTEMMPMSRKIEERIRLLQALQNDPRLPQAAGFLYSALKQGKQLFIFGNGGSATQASHFAAELVNRFYRDRRALPAVALAADMAVLTSIANDYAFASIFSRQVEALGRPGDVAIGLTTSGRSENVLRALALGRKLGLGTLALCGRNQKKLQEAEIDCIVAIDADDTPVIQEIHLFILHYFAEYLENLFSKE